MILFMREIGLLTEFGIHYMKMYRAECAFTRRGSVKHCELRVWMVQRRATSSNRKQWCSADFRTLIYSQTKHRRVTASAGDLNCACFDSAIPIIESDAPVASL
jgi:hypothetical protein